jgi:hypothetical protein
MCTEYAGDLEGVYLPCGWMVHAGALGLFEFSQFGDVEPVAVGYSADQGAEGLPEAGVLEEVEAFSV